MNNLIGGDPTSSSGPPVWASLFSALVRRLPMGRYRVMNWLCKRSQARFVAQIPGSMEGLRFECDLRNGLAREVFFMGNYEPQETLIVRRLIKSGGVFVDVGSHWGYFTLLVAEHVGVEGRVVAIEADPRIHEILDRSVALNHLPQIETVHAAVAAKSGTLSLIGFDEQSDNWGVSRISTVADPSSFDVPAVSLDALLDELAVDDVDLIKIDIEGAEALALEGMSEGLRRGRYHRILLELHPTQLAELGTSAASIVERLLQYGYHGWVISHGASDVRRMAYGKKNLDESMVRPLRWPESLDEWPHMIFARSGRSLFVA